MAPLKPLGADAQISVVLDFHNEKVMAPLKRQEEDIHTKQGEEFP